MAFEKATGDVAIVFDDATGEPRMIIVNSSNLDDPSFNPPGHTQVKISKDIYNSGFKNPEGVHKDAITHAKQEFLKIKGRK